MIEATPGVKRGYLHKDFQLFHITDKTEQAFKFHYHEFNKIIVFLSGNVTYLIEGKAYKLKPWDILLINNQDVHKPIIDSTQTYDRIILWIDNHFLEEHSYEGCNLNTCFELANRKTFNLIRLNPSLQDNLKQLISHLEISFHSKEFGTELLTNSLFFEFLIYLNRISLNNSYINDETSLEYDKQIESVIKYINTNLEANLSVESIANEFFINKHYLMHKFKTKTGYTVHNYIIMKRLFKSIDLIKSGMPITQSAEQCGFGDYSTYLRTFKKTFHCSPKDFFYNQPQKGTYLM